MTTLVYGLYAAILSPLAWMIFQAGAWSSPKWARLRRLKNARHFDFPTGLTAPLIAARRPFWIHAASGEVEYARPVLRALKARFPGVPIVLTYSSPSALPLIQRIPEIDAAGPVPWEFFWEFNRFLNRFRPRALLIARTDAWPVMVRAASRRMPTLLFSATFADNSSRLRWPGRLLTADVLARLDAVQVVSPEDAAALAPLEIRTPIDVAGDTRFDQVLHRLATSADPADRPARPKDPVLIAGSTWPEDETQLLPALVQCPQWRALIAPHQVDAQRLQSLTADLDRHGLTWQRLSAGGPWQQRVMILDRVGILAEAYGWGDLAFVGGSFRRQVHSVMEPLASGLRVIVGPFHRNNREALEFQRVEVLGRPAVRVAQHSDQLAEILREEAGPAVGRPLVAEIEVRRGATQAVVTWCTAVADLTTPQ